MSVNSSATTIIQPPLSPTSTAHEVQCSSSKPKNVVINLEKHDSLNREEIIHYPAYDDECSRPASYTPSNSSHPSSSPVHPWITAFRQWRHKYREYLAEFLGTLILVLLVNGVSAEQRLPVTGSDKSWLTTAFGNGLSVLLAISVSGHISGAHMNPVITLTFWLFSGFPRRKVPGYCAAQLAGSFMGAATLYAIIKPALDQFDGGERAILGNTGTAGIFATYPPLYVGIGAAIASEVVGTAILLVLVMTTGHPNNQPFCGVQGFVVASGISAILLAIGYTSGFSLNPARDIGPRLFTACAGWGSGVFTAANYYAFVPMFAPLLGGLVGGITYTIFIDHAPAT